MDSFTKLKTKMKKRDREVVSFIQEEKDVSQGKTSQGCLSVKD